MYADTITESMRAAIEETERRRTAQERYNREHGITPITIVKEIRDINDRLRAVAEHGAAYEAAEGRNLTGSSRAQIETLVGRMEAEMRLAARNLEFERAAALRDEIQSIRLRVLEDDASLVVERAAEAAAEGRPPRSAGGPRGGRGRRGERGGNAGDGRPAASDTSVLEVTEVRVVAAGDEPAGIDEGTAADWLPGLRDEHDDDGGWQAGWLDRPTWDRTVTPNIRHRQGRRSPRRG